MTAETRAMRIHTVNFGDLEVPEDSIITFKEGLPGFPQIHRFVVIELEDLQPFRYLQALDDPPIALLVVNPFVVEPQFEFQLSNSDMEDIECGQSEDITVYAVATIPDRPEEATINLMAPVIINEKSRLGKQAILHDAALSIKQPLLKTSKNISQNKHP